MNASIIRDAVRIALTMPEIAVDAREVAKVAQGWANALDVEILAGIVARGETHRLMPVKPTVRGPR
jgi:hypothetical protein